MATLGFTGRCLLNCHQMVLSRCLGPGCLLIGSWVYVLMVRCVASRHAKEPHSWGNSSGHSGTSGIRPHRVLMSASLRIFEVYPHLLHASTLLLSNVWKRPGIHVSSFVSIHLLRTLGVSFWFFDSSLWSLPSSKRALASSWGSTFVTPSKPNTLRAPHLQIPWHWGLGVQRMNFRGHRNIVYNSWAFSYLILK